MWKFKEPLDGGNPTKELNCKFIVAKFRMAVIELKNVWQ